MSLPSIALAVFTFALSGFARADTVDLKNDFASLAQNRYFVRVGVQQDEPAGRIVPDGPFVLHDRMGRVLYDAKESEPIGLTCHDTEPGSTVYYYLLAAFPDAERTQAEAFARKARERLEAPVTVRVDPRTEYSPSPFGEPPAVPPRLVVAAGPFGSRAEARRHERLVYSYYKAEYFQTVESRATGRIRAVDAKGRVVAEAESYIGVRARRRGSRMRVNGLRSLYHGWSNPSSWADNREYRGLMEVWINPRGRLSMVNRVFIEHYLYGVLPAEIGAGAPEEMLKVQAVISRSIAINYLRQNRHAGWHYDLCDSQHCQVYKGALSESARVNAAIDATRGQVCVYDNHIINAVYSRCCGGVTACNSHVWEGKPLHYLQSKYDSLQYPGRPDLSDYRQAEKWIAARPPVHCNPDQNGCPSYLRKAFRWQRTYTAEQLRRNLHRVRKAHGEFDKPVTNLRVLRRRTSGRVVAIQVDLGKDARRISGEQDIRQALGTYDNWLPSTFFVLDRSFDKKGDLEKVTIMGAGWGHGVGLCQTGAYMLASQGTNYVTILKHYYTGSEVYKIYE